MHVSIKVSSLRLIRWVFPPPSCDWEASVWGWVPDPPRRYHAGTATSLRTAGHSRSSSWPRGCRPSSWRSCCSLSSPEDLQQTVAMSCSHRTIRNRWQCLLATEERVGEMLIGTKLMTWIHAFYPSQNKNNLTSRSYLWKGTEGVKGLNIYQNNAKISRYLQKC